MSTTGIIKPKLIPWLSTVENMPPLGPVPSLRGFSVALCWATSWLGKVSDAGASLPNMKVGRCALLALGANSCFHFPLKTYTSPSLRVGEAQYSSILSKLGPRFIFP